MKTTPDFSMETIKIRRSWSSIMQILRYQRCQPRLLCPAKLSITIDEENKIFHDRTRFNQYLATNQALQKALEKNSNPRKFIFTETQKIDDLTVANLKEGEKHTE